MIWSDIPGWSCNNMLQLYRNWALYAGPGTFVEVGVAYGRSLAVLAQCTAPDCRIYGIDTWSEFMGGDNLPPDVFEAQRAHGTPLDACKANLAACGVLEIVTLVQADSVEAAKAFTDHSVDFVFIDADHTYEGVRRDIAAWRSKVKDTGILAGHDYSLSMFPGVVQAVEEAFGDRQRMLDGVVWSVWGRDL